MHGLSFNRYFTAFFKMVAAVVQCSSDTKYVESVLFLQVKGTAPNKSVLPPECT